MIPLSCFEGQRIALFGLGGSGLATARALLTGGAEVAAWDDGEAARDNARREGLPVVDLAAADWGAFSALVLAPGVPLTHPEPHWAVKEARASGVEIIGDIELFCRERRAIAPGSPFVAITGTNGKSTTTALIAHLLRQADRDVHLGGNIGVPILDLAPPSADRIHVVECSSFQIDLAPSLDPTIGLLINLTPDHLDRHGTMEDYAAIKERLVARSEVALVGADDEFCRAAASRLARQRIAPPRLLTISAGPTHSADVFIEDGEIVMRGRRGGEEVLMLAGARALRGAHNAQNAAFAAAAARELGLSLAAIARGFETFPGLAHRMEEVAAIGGVIFVNDSKATNSDAAEKALLSFTDIFWIVGGKPKEGGIEPLRPLFPKIAKAYLIGAASDAFAETLEGSVPFERCGTLDIATIAAARDAAASAADEPVVLLSPACASYDQFANFEARGDRFRALVQALVAAQGDAEDDV